MKKSNRVLVIGGGASGMLAAIIAAGNGAVVKIIEQMPRVGKKLLATGNGRCNITNMNITLERFHGENVKFAEYALKEFDANKAMQFFESIGLSTREEEDGKVYPFSGQASSVLDIMRYEIDRLGIEVICEAEVKQILNKKGEFTVILKSGDKVTGDKVILAAGGRANSNLGSTGTAYRLATDFGHTVIDTFPALVQLKLNSNSLKALAGVKFIGRASIVSDGNLVKDEDGEILFADYGISGPPILQLSRLATEKLKYSNDVVVRLDMFPLMSKEQIIGTLKNKVSLDPNKPIDFCLVGYINKKLIPIVLRAAGILDIHKSCSEVTAEELEEITEILKNWEFQITGTQPWRDAQVTAGGIDVEEVDNRTMESKLIKGLFICGEILDIDGDCGGFNLQWAWSSGYLAGLNAAKA